MVALFEPVHCAGVSVSHDCLLQPEGSQEPVSLLSDQVLEDFVTSKPQPAGVVSWSPPQPNWNPWTACNIDEGPLATVINILLVVRLYWMYCRDLSITKIFSLEKKACYLHDYDFRPNEIHRHRKLNQLRQSNGGCIGSIEKSTLVFMVFGTVICEQVLFLRFNLAIFTHPILVSLNL